MNETTELQYIYGWDLTCDHGGEVIPEGSAAYITENAGEHVRAVCPEHHAQEGVVR
jgi:hypothetical protein